MKTQDYFDLGCKIFGVYFLFLSVNLFIRAIGSFYPVENAPVELEKYLMFDTLITRLLPFIYVGIGIYLIKNSRKLFFFAYRNIEEPDVSESSEKFRLFLKMLGIYLFSDYIPTLIHSLTSCFTILSTPKVWDLFTHQQYISHNFIPSIVAIVLGLYLIRSGDFFVNLGFRKNKESDKDKT
jgi:hypothetical protein